MLCVEIDARVEHCIWLYVAALRTPADEARVHNQGVLSQLRAEIANDLHITKEEAQVFFEAVAHEENRAAWSAAYDQGYTKGRDMEVALHSW